MTFQQYSLKWSSWCGRAHRSHGSPSRNDAAELQVHNSPDPEGFISVAAPSPHATSREHGLVYCGNHSLTVGMSDIIGPPILSADIGIKKSISENIGIGFLRSSKWLKWPMACYTLLESSNCPESNASDHFLLVQRQCEINKHFVWNNFRHLLCF